jgi:hypothetical protein
LFAGLLEFNQDDVLALIRTGRYAWIAGQVIFILLLSAVITLVTRAVSLLIIANVVTFNMEGWGSVVSTLAYTDSASVFKLNFSISEKVIVNLAPSFSFCIQLLFQFFSTALMGYLILFGYVTFGKIVGLLLGGILAFLDLIIDNSLPYIFYRFSPFSLCRLQNINLGNAYGSILPSFEWCIVFYLVLGSFLVLISLLVTRKLPFLFDKNYSLLG